MSDKEYEYPEDLTEEEQRAIEHARSMVTTSVPRKRISPKDVFLTIVYFVSWFGGCFLVSDIAEFFHLPFATAIGSIGWSCCFGIAVYLSVEEKKNF